MRQLSFLGFTLFLIFLGTAAKSEITPQAK